MSTRWHDCPENTRLGELLFCAEIYNDGLSRLESSRTPFSKNMSGENILHGWCGSTNNVSTTAIGVGIVRRLSDRIDDDGESVPRAQIQLLLRADQRVVDLCEEMDVTTPKDE